MKPIKMNEFYPALAVTYLNMLSGVVGMYFVYIGQVNIALICLVIAAFFDVFDGFFARLSKQTKKQNSIGIIADSLADMISFGILPVIIILSTVASSFILFLVIALYVLLAAHRLIIFSVDALENRKPTKIFYGLPVVSNALWLPLSFIAFHSMPWFCIYLIIQTLVTAVLFVSSIPIPKPRGVFAYLIYIFLAVVLVIGLLPW